VEVNLKSIIEAVLFAADEPISVGRLKTVIETADARQIKACVEELNGEYKASNRAFVIEEVAEGYRMFTRPEFNEWLGKLFRQRSKGRLSLAALETLAIIAYKQPIERAQIEDIRGVNVDHIVRTLHEKELIKIVGRSEKLGRPLLYGTTKKFLEHFGLKSLGDLPRVSELEKQRAPDADEEPSDDSGEQLEDVSAESPRAGCEGQGNKPEGEAASDPGDGVSEGLESEESTKDSE